MQHHTQPNHKIRQPRRTKRKQTKKTQHCVGVPPAPDIDKGAGQGGAEKGLVEEGGEAQQGGGGVGDHPGKVGGADGGLFEHAGVALDEEHVEDEVEGERAEVDEGGDEAPVLLGWERLVRCSCDRVVVRACPLFPPTNILVRIFSTADWDQLTWLLWNTARKL